MKVGILNSGGFNFNSIKFALNRIGVFDIEIVKSPYEFEMCERIIIPGVGHAGVAMEMIESQNLGNCIKNTKKPVLGICL
jgi:glutamine amidotransferase